MPLICYEHSTFLFAQINGGELVVLRGRRRKRLSRVCFDSWLVLPSLSLPSLSLFSADVLHSCTVGFSMDYSTHAVEEEEWFQCLSPVVMIHLSLSLLSFFARGANWYGGICRHLHHISSSYGFHQLNCTSKNSPSL